MKQWLARNHKVLKEMVVYCLIAATVTCVLHFLTSISVHDADVMLSILVGLIVGRYFGLVGGNDDA